MVGRFCRRQLCSNTLIHFFFSGGGCVHLGWLVVVLTVAAGLRKHWRAGGSLKEHSIASADSAVRRKGAQGEFIACYGTVCL